MKKRILGVLVAIVFLCCSNVAAVSAIDTAGVCLANDWVGSWWTDAQNFTTRISSHTNWLAWSSHSPTSSWWKEESNGGIDNSKADAVQLALIQSHVYGDIGNGVMGMGFGTSAGYAAPSQVRLGYASPDNVGANIWCFVIECSLLKSTSWPAWQQNTLTGMHQMLGFSNDPTISSVDLDELAKRLTGTGGFSKETVTNSFVNTYLKRDGIHNLNSPRVNAEDHGVQSDYIDSYTAKFTVNAHKQTWSWQ